MVRSRNRTGRNPAPVSHTESENLETAAAEAPRVSRSHRRRNASRAFFLQGGSKKIALIAGIALGGAAVLLALILAALQLFSSRALKTVPAHSVLWGDAAIGTVEDASTLIADYDAWRASQEKQKGMAFSQASCLSYEPVTVEEGDLFSDTASLLALAKDRTPQTYCGTVLQVAGHDMLAMTSPEAVQEVLDELLSMNEKAILETLSATTPNAVLPEGSMTFAESVETVERVITPKDALSVSQAVELLSQTTGSAQMTYTVKSGDTLAKIASAHQTTQAALLEANPELESANLIVVGQELRLRSESRPLNVVVSFTQTREEVVPHTTEKKNNGSMKKGTTKVTQEGVDGLSVVTAEETYLNGTLASRTTLSEEVKKEMVPEIVQVGTKVINSYGNPVFPYPVSGYRISSRFGPRNVSVGSSNHKGIDLAVPMGTPVYASADGTVHFSGEATGYGLVVYINHADGYQTRYAHNSRLVVKKGETVKKGQLIAYAGNTGVSSGPHCHFEIRKDGVAVNPEKYQ